MSEIADLCILPNPAHRPKFYAGYPGLSSSFPATVVCIVYLHLLADMPATSLCLTLKSTLRADSSCAPQSQGSWLARASRENLVNSFSRPAPRHLTFPLKRRLYTKRFVLWKEGNLVADEEQDRHQFTVRYVTPTAVFHVRQDLDPMIREMIRRRESELGSGDFQQQQQQQQQGNSSLQVPGSTRALPRARSMDELARKPSLYPVREYPAATQKLARGTHLFYFECEVPDLPGDLFTPHMRISHHLTAKLITPSRPFPFNLVTREWTEQFTVPLALPRYSPLPELLSEFPINMRNAPGDPIHFEVKLADRVLIPGTVFHVIVRLVPDPVVSPAASRPISRAGSTIASDDHHQQQQQDEGSEPSQSIPQLTLNVMDDTQIVTFKRNARPPPRVDVKLKQTVIIRSRPAGGVEGERRWTSTILEVPDGASSTGDLWKRKIGLPLPPANCSIDGLLGGEDALHPSCVYRVYLGTPPVTKRGPRRGGGSGSTTPRDLEKPEEPMVSGLLGGEATAALSQPMLMVPDINTGGTNTPSASMELGNPPRFTSSARTASTLTRTLRKAMSALSLRNVSAVCTPATSNHGTQRRPSSHTDNEESEIPNDPRAPAPAQAVRPSQATSPTSTQSSSSGGAMDSHADVTLSLPHSDSAVSEESSHASGTATPAAVHTGLRGARSATAPSTTGTAARRNRPTSVPSRLHLVTKADDSNAGESTDDEDMPDPSPTDGRGPPSYKELDAPTPCYWVSPGCDLPGADELEICIRHELIVTGTVVSNNNNSASNSHLPLLGNSGTTTDKVELAIPVTVNYGNRRTREDVLRYVCA